MELKLEMPIRFNRGSEHRSLYSWSLSELSPSGEKLGRDLVPWAWTLQFDAVDLRVHTNHRLERVHQADRSPATERHVSKVLIASLRLDAEYSSEALSRTKLSMLGTEREVSTIVLRVESSASEEDAETCALWGCPSYTVEIDFEDRTIPDTLQLQLSLVPSRFEELCAIAARATPISLSVMISRVSGFYSDWSPANVTDSVKILTGDEGHIVDGAPDLGPALPRLGDVGEFTLSLIQHAAVHAPAIVADSDYDSARVETPHTAVTVTSPEVDALQKLLREHALTRQAIASVAIPVWIAVVLLGLLLFWR